VLDDGVVSVCETGTGQGAVISPLLANIYLHHFGLASSLGEKRSPQDQEFPSPDSKAFVAGPSGWHRPRAADAGEGSGAFAGPNSESLHRALCGRGETSKRARRSRGAGILGRIEGVAARGFRSGSARDRAPVVPAIEPFACLGELRRDFALQAVDLASKFGDGRL
jgi:hypothetical protein